MTLNEGSAELKLPADTLLLRIQAAELPPPGSPDEALTEPQILAARGDPGVVYRIHAPIPLKLLSELIGVKPNVLIMQLMKMNVFATIADKIDLKHAQELGAKFKLRIEAEAKAPTPKPPPPPPPDKPKEPKKKKIEAPASPDRSAELEGRPPVVTILGHVDHGKTTLLDAIRKTRVAAGESGGITQHIGAYMVTSNDRQIAFIDTPGHAAFTAMRARGANVTDIAIIVVAADDGIKPQTLEAIQHARAASVTIMVAITKIDLPNANLNRVYGQLQQNNLAPEQLGGNTICCPVSAVRGDGLPDLLGMIQLQADILELKANPHAKASGFVLEARMEPGMGPVATGLVKQGTLKVGDAVVCGEAWGKVKALINDRGIKIRTAGPSHAIQILGLTRVPEAGAEFIVVDSDREAKTTAEERIATVRATSLSAPKRGMSLETFMNQANVSTLPELPIVLRADVQGSAEALEQALNEIKSEKVTLRVVLAGVGSITTNDILLAKASKAIILGFHVSPESGVAKLAKHESVEIRLYSIIYEMIDDIRRAMAGLLDPLLKESILGKAEVKQVFRLNRKGVVAGCMVTGGKITSRARARVRRQNDIVFEGSVASLRRYQSDAAEVRDGQECGIRLDGFSAVQTGDVIEAYEVQKIVQEL
jgi:translation initiation factor IF-2